MGNWLLLKNCEPIIWGQRDGMGHKPWSVINSASLTIHLQTFLLRGFTAACYTSSTFATEKTIHSVSRNCLSVTYVLNIWKKKKIVLFFSSIRELQHRCDCIMVWAFSHWLSICPLQWLQVACLQNSLTLTWPTLKITIDWHETADYSPAPKMFDSIRLRCMNELTQTAHMHQMGQTTAT